ncbi:MAG TPA: site-specific integrase [Bryobacteraceae bacterium]|nr:site-specific integrase [Bryobacteraceae bacterium]
MARDGLRIRGGKWAYRFWVNGRCYPGTTDLAATERNRNAAIRQREEHRRAILEGRDFQQRVTVIPFNEAAEMFLKWADAEHRTHPATARRLRGSFTSLQQFFGRTPVSVITPGAIEDYKAMRRTEHKVKEVTLRNDLHALSKFFKYAKKHRWARTNPVEEVDIPSDADAVRMHVLTAAEEALYFATCLQGERTVKIKEHKRQGTVTIREHERTVDCNRRDLYDLGRLMLNQGCRPEELLSMRKDAVDLEAGTMRIVRGKSRAARRTLKLTAESRSILAARMNSDGPWVFPSPRLPGEHLLSVNSAHGAVLEETGLHFVIYDFRHTCATRWAKRGMDLATLARLLGHSNLRSVMKYVHIDQEHMDRAMELYGSDSEVGWRSVASTNQRESALSGVIQGEETGSGKVIETNGKVH